VKRRRGNPNMRVGAPSLNPSGRPKAYPELRALCQQKTIEGVEAIYEIAMDPAQPGSTRVAAWCALRDTGFDRPAQRIAFEDFTDTPDEELPEQLDLYASAGAYEDMILGRPTRIIDVTPEPSAAPTSRSRALPAPRRDLDQDEDRETERARQLAELRRMADEEAAEQRAARPRERVRRTAPPPPPRHQERVRRPR
jgi:hypothetical protein